MISINKWFSKNAKRPLIYLGLGTIFLQLCFISYIFLVQNKNQIKSVENLFTIANLALEQKNRPVLESIIDLALDELNAQNIFLCNGKKTIMAYPLNSHNCENLPVKTFFTRKLELEAIGRPDYQFYFYVPLFHLTQSYLILFGMTFIFFIFSILIILKVQRRFAEDILNPLENNLLSDKAINISQLDQLRNKIKEIQEVKEKEAAASAILEHKARVAHNIRSLVQTLKSLRPSIDEKLSTSKKALFNDVVQGIGDILTEFSTKNVSIANKLNPSFNDNIDQINKNRTPIEITDVITSVINQKRFEFKSSDPNSSITCKIDENLNDSFIEIEEMEFKVILSNVINNAFESKESNPKKIKVSVIKIDNKVEIRVTDNGKGIPTQIRDSLFENGVTYGKINGTGYGLYHAKIFLTSWDGLINIESSSEIGTTILIKIPLWKPEAIKLKDGDTVVVLDDDIIVHEAWSNQLNFWEKNTGKKVNKKYFTSPEQTEKWILDSEIDYSRTLFFIDNDLGKEIATGSSLIAHMGIEEVATLVTNRYDNKELIKFCREKNIKLLPKSYVFSNYDQVFS